MNPWLEVALVVGGFVLCIWPTFSAKSKTPPQKERVTCR